MTINQSRTETVYRLMLVYAQYKGMECDTEALVVDLLADLRHYCEEYAIDYYNCDHIAYEHYIEERFDPGVSYFVQPSPPWYVWSNGNFGRVPESGGDIDSIPF